MLISLISTVSSSTPSLSLHRFLSISFSPSLVLYLLFPSLVSIYRLHLSSLCLYFHFSFYPSLSLLHTTSSISLLT